MRERQDFWEFVGCNLLFAGVATAVVIVRTKRGNLQRARALAARIGIGGATVYARVRYVVSGPAEEVPLADKHFIDSRSH